ncbi:MAG: hypothetical protein R2831_03605 [Chitinophagaceae bacterium]
MDISKYIGSFLLKNRFCSLPGLGAFDLKKQSASIMTDEQKVAPQKYIISFTSVGSIDDTFASYIASKENVSISNASNNIKSYCLEAKQELNKTGKFYIENIGELIARNNQIEFKQAEDLNLGVEPIPAVMTEIKSMAPKPEQKIDFSYKQTKYKRQKPFPWMQIALPIIAIGLLGAIAFFGYTYYQQNKEKETTVYENIDLNATPESQVQTSDSSVASSDTLSTQTQQNIQDTTTAIASQNAPMAVTPPPPSGQEYRVVVYTASNEASANAKAEKWKRYGNKANVVYKDSNYYVTIDASQPQNNQELLVDSLRKFFNPSGNVFILK